MWAAIEADFHREYGVDLSARGFLRSRTWRWFTVRLANLSPECATGRVLRKAAKGSDGGAGAMGALSRAART